MKKESSTEETSFLFNVDILVQGQSNGHALQALLDTLNHMESAADYRIKSGIELGSLIEAALQVKRGSMASLSGIKSQASQTSSPAGKSRANVQSESKQMTDKPASVTEKPSSSGSSITGDLSTWIQEQIQGNKLVRIIVNRYGRQQSIPCRILNFDLSNGLINVYHVDEKQVYSFRTNEIDEFKVF
ncbi:hypothetical protein Q5741_18990 [Paenibacillus sp. JX-17]|uniref:WYL domain-containing protein n=1 Tax=Paenibacillus lacisoli TaxID=3064525 RepID=A0ABT9CGX3_9BACL|nr:hypothetical protein [Paenibacillus sp. JX-17]MDO7908490.1 hypothetical protein [Paenibacillus sp. JX-17]